MIPLSDGIPRRVDRVGDRDDRRQRRADRVVAELGLPLAGQRAVADCQLRHLRHDRVAQLLGDRRPEAGATAVGRLLAEQHEIRVFVRERAGKRDGRLQHVRVLERRIRDQDCAVRTHRQRLPQGVHRLFGAHRDDDDLALAGRLLELEALLDRVRVEVGDHELARAVETLRRGIDPPSGGRVGHGFHAHGDLHAARTLAS